MSNHHEEMEAHYAAGIERQDEEHLREITPWLTDLMCRVEEPLIGQVSNPLSVNGAQRLNDLMQANVHYGGAGLRGIRGSRADIDLVRHWQAEAARVAVLVERCRSWQAVAERLETEMQDLLSVCDAEIRDQTNNRTASDNRSAAYAEGALRVARGIASRIASKSAVRRAVYAPDALKAENERMRAELANGFEARARRALGDPRIGVNLKAGSNAPWPSGCLKPNSCGRHRGCMYAQSSDACRHFGKDLTAAVEAAEAARAALAQRGGDDA